MKLKVKIIDMVGGGAWLEYKVISTYTTTPSFISESLFLVTNLRNIGKNAILQHLITLLVAQMTFQPLIFIGYCSSK